MMKLRHLRYFIAVAEELSFSRAAQRLYVSQPPLSRQIRDLESEFNVKLFERNRQEVKLTRVGGALLARARELIRDAEALRTLAHEMADSSSLANLPAIHPSSVPMDKLVGYCAADFPEYHQWVAKVLGVSKTRVVISQECDGVMSVIAAVESGQAPAVVGEFTTAVAGDRVRYIPFASKASYMDVGLLHRKSENPENIKKLIASSLDFKPVSKKRP
jgi:DNA-binding transcriptional LysR family regulator